MKKLNVLIRGWNLHHSYALVNCFQMIHFVKYFSDRINIVFEQVPYYNLKWKKKENTFPREYEEILKNIQVYDKFTNYEFDLIYNISFPYVVTFDPKFSNIKKYVFYTAEFRNLNIQYFENMENKQVDFLINDKTLFFTGPSKWSCDGLNKFCPELRDRNFCISHGVDTSIFKRNISNRQIIRNKYNICKDDIVLLNIGSMTGNKGIDLLLMALFHLVEHNSTKWKLFLKGTSDLYSSRDFVSNSLNIVKHYARDEEVKTRFDNFIKKHVIFIDDTFSCEFLNILYNACDLYASPYGAEGFNLAPLEALSAGLPILLPETGSTVDYISNIEQHCSLETCSKMIFKIKSKVVNIPSGEMNKIEVSDVVNSLLKFQTSARSEENYKEIYNFLQNTLSWKQICSQLLELWSSKI